MISKPKGPVSFRVTNIYKTAADVNGYIRQEISGGLGPLCLNLSGLEPSQADTIANTLRSVVPKLLHQPLSVSELNAGPWAPKKDYATERLAGGRLQLSPGTLVLLDETKLEPGTLQAQGIRNLASLKQVMRRQELDYDFHYHTTAFQTDYPIICLSEGRSLLQMDWDVKVTGEGSETSHLSPQLLQAVRWLVSAGRESEYGLAEGMEKMVEEDFVLMRKDNANFGPENLQRLLLLARLLTISAGEKELGPEKWASAKRMEEARIKRLS